MSATPTPEWRIDEIRDEASEHMESGAYNLPAATARFTVEIVDRMRAAEKLNAELLAACEMALHRISGECWPDHPEVLQLEAAIAKAGGK